MTRKIRKPLYWGSVTGVGGADTCHEYEHAFDDRRRLNDMTSPPAL